MDAPQTTLHDTITEQFDKVIPPEEPAAPVAADAPAPAADAAPVEAPKDDRARDEAGRFVAAEKPQRAKDNKGFVSTAAPKADTTPKADEAAQPAAAVEPPVKPLGRPSSWKKEMWPLWDKLANGVPLDAKEARQVAEYNLQRENEAAKGVSTYKAWADRAKPLVDAFEPHRSDFERWGIDPGQQFSKYVEIHKGLALGTPEQKLGVLMRIAQDYQIPVQNLFVQKDGQLYFNPQAAAPVPPQREQQPAITPQSIEQQVQAVLQHERTAAEIAAMAEDTQKYPHFEALRHSMAQLLDARIAKDLPGAYETALALPQHRELAAEAARQQQAADEAARKAKQAAEAQRARAAAVSPKSATPASAPVQARKGLRDTLAEQVEAIGSGRV